MESLKYWLEEIKRNYEEKKLTHWEISVLISQCLQNLEKSAKDDLTTQIQPLLQTLIEKGSTHKHKQLIAEFTLKLIEKWEEKEKDNFF